MSCKEVTERELLDLAAGRLSPEEARLLTRHLAGCPECQRDFAACETAWSKLDAFARASETDGSPEVPRKVLAEAAALQSGTVRRGRRHTSARLRRVRSRRPAKALWFLPIAAAAAVVVVFLLQQRPATQPPSTVAHTAKTAAEAPSAETGVTPTPPPVELAEARPEPVPALADLRADERETPAAPVSFGPLESVPVQGPAVVQRPAERSPESRTLPEEPLEGPAPPRVETARPVGRLALTEGNVYYRRVGSERTFRAQEGLHFTAGDEFDTRFGKARVELVDGAVAYCSKGTVFTLSKGRLDIRKGELYCDVRGVEKLDVVSVDGTVRHIGTKFLVKVRSSGTTVLVEEGRVEVENSEGKVSVDAGWQVSVRKGREPAKPRKAEVAKALAWTRTLGTSTAALYSEDFDTTLVGRLPARWTVYWGGGDWTVQELDGKRVLHNSGQSAVLFSDREWRDCRVDAKVKITRLGWAHMFVRARPKANYEFGMERRDGKTFAAVRKSVGDEDTVVSAAPFDFKLGEWVTLTAVAQGDELRLLINGREVVRARDATYSSGGIGFCTGAGTQMAVDEVTVRRLPLEQ